MKQYLVIDGYNVIHAKAGLLGEAPAHLEQEREQLINRCANYSALHEYDTTLVFDAWIRDQPLTEKMISGIRVVYTNKDQTADSYIERYLYRLPKLNRKIAVTSDGAIQKMALMTGAERMTSLEFLAELESEEKKHARARSGNGSGDNRIVEHLADGQKGTIEAIRRGSKPEAARSAGETASGAEDGRKAEIKARKALKQEEGLKKARQAAEARVPGAPPEKELSKSQKRRQRAKKKKRNRPNRGSSNKKQ